MVVKGINVKYDVLSSIATVARLKHTNESLGENAIKLYSRRSRDKFLEVARMNGYETFTDMDGTPCIYDHDFMGTNAALCKK